MNKGQFNAHNNVTIRSLKNYCSEDFIQKLTVADWSEVFTSNNVNDSWRHFKDTFLSVLDSVAPVKEVRLKQRSEPWLSNEILELIKSRDCYLNKFKKERNEDFYKKYIVS